MAQPLSRKVLLEDSESRASLLSAASSKWIVYSRCPFNMLLTYERQGTNGIQVRESANVKLGISSGKALPLITALILSENASIVVFIMRNSLASKGCLQIMRLEVDNGNDLSKSIFLILEIDANDIVNDKFTRAMHSILITAVTIISQNFH